MTSLHVRSWQHGAEGGAPIARTVCSCGWASEWGPPLTGGALHGCPRESGPNAKVIAHPSALERELRGSFADFGKATRQATLRALEGEQESKLGRLQHEAALVLKARPELATSFRNFARLVERLGVLDELIAEQTKALGAEEE